MTLYNNFIYNELNDTFYILVYKCTYANKNTYI